MKLGIPDNFKEHFNIMSGYAYILLILSPLAVLGLGMHDRDKRLQKEQEKLKIEQDNSNELNRVRNDDLKFE